MICDRCDKETGIYTMSFFNTDTICMECKQKEVEHPDYEEAVAVETEQVKAGNYSFPGVGKPTDL